MSINNIIKRKLYINCLIHLQSWIKRGGNFHIFCVSNYLNPLYVHPSVRQSVCPSGRQNHLWAPRVLVLQLKTADLHRSQKEAPHRGAEFLVDILIGVQNKQCCGILQECFYLILKYSGGLLSILTRQDVNYKQFIVLAYNKTSTYMR